MQHPCGHLHACGGPASQTCLNCLVADHAQEANTAHSSATWDQHACSQELSMLAKHQHSKHCHAMHLISCSDMLMVHVHVQVAHNDLQDVYQVRTGSTGTASMILNASSIHQHAAVWMYRGSRSVQRILLSAGSMFRLLHQRD